MESADEAIIIRWASAHSQEAVTLSAFLSESREGLFLRDFCRYLKRAAPFVHFDMADARPGEPPCLNPAPNIVYQAAPSGAELELFLSVLAGEPPVSPEKIPPAADLLESLEKPVNLDLYISSHCPFCPHVAGPLLSLALLCPKIVLNVIDGTLFEERAENAGIKAVPTLILEDGFRWTGKVALEEVINVAAHRDGADFGVDTLKAIVTGGNAGTAARMMIDRGRIYPAFVDLLTDPDWSVRLGAMVVFEYLCEAGENLATAVVDTLWSRFETLSGEVQADMVQMMGDARLPRAQEKVRAVADGSFDDAVKDVAREFLE